MTDFTHMTNDDLIAERERRREAVRLLQQVGAASETVIGAAQRLGLVRSEMLRRGIEAKYIDSLKGERVNV